METAYVMLTGDDGVPKALPSPLFTLPERAACLWLFLAQCQPAVLWRRTDVFPITASFWKAGTPRPRQQTNAPVEGRGWEGDVAFSV